MNIEKIRSWLNNGMDIGAHSTSHINLTNLNFFKKKIEIETPKKYFKDIFSLEIDSFSYPFGKFDDESINLVKSNYKIGLTTLRSRFKTDKFSNFTLPRVPINKSTNIFKFFLKIKTPYEDLKYKNNVIL